MKGQQACSVKEQVITGLGEAKDRVRQAREFVVAEAPCQQILHETSAAQDLLTDLQVTLLYNRLLHCLSYVEGKDSQTTERNRQGILKLFATVGRLPIPPPSLET